VAKYAGLKDGQLRPVYVLIRDVPETNWGLFGDPVNLHALKNRPADAKPI
jgi:phenylpyruvate tautomerase PptA (4-oxalocrotonate tautomerase family)